MKTTSQIIIEKTSKAFGLIALVILGFGFVLPQRGFCAQPPLVWITAGQDAVKPGPYGCYADEGTNVGTFVISRFGDTNTSLTVYLSRSGTAVGPSTDIITPCFTDYGVDYHLSVNYTYDTSCNDGGVQESVTIPAGSFSTTVSIIPLLDWDCPADKTLTLTIVGTDDPAYVVVDSSATIQIHGTYAFGAALYQLPLAAGVIAGDSITLECARTCGCAYPSPLFSVPDTQVFYLLGTAQYGQDYTIDTMGQNVAIFNPVFNPSITALSVTLGTSNNAVQFALDTYANCSYSNKTVLFVSECYYAPDCSQLSPPMDATNSQGCLYSIGYNVPALIIYHPSIQPTLDSAEFTNSIFQFNVNGQNGATYTVAASTNLIDWTDLGSFTMTACTMKVSDSMAGNFAQRYYRIEIGSSDASGQGLSFEESSRSLVVRQSPSVYLSGANAMSAASVNASSLHQALSPEARWLLIEAERLRLEEAGDPAAILLPPTPLTPKTQSH